MVGYMRKNLTDNGGFPAEALMNINKINRVHERGNQRMKISGCIKTPVFYLVSVQNALILSYPSCFVGYPSSKKCEKTGFPPEFTCTYVQAGMTS
jgi:hypothetical protein